jgi:hypothetical protein
MCMVVPTSVHSRQAPSLVTANSLPVPTVNKQSWNIIHYTTVCYNSFIQDGYSFCEVTWQHSWLRHYATSQKALGSIHDDVTKFFNWPNPCSHTMALGSTQSLTQVNTKNLPGGKGWPVRKADDLNAICVPTVYEMWEPRLLTTPMGLHSLLAIALPLLFNLWGTEERNKLGNIYIV